MIKGELKVPTPHETLFGQGVSLCCDERGELRSDDLHGFFVADTRILSTYRILVNSQRWNLLGRSQTGRGSAEWTFQNPQIRNPQEELEAGKIFFRLRRRLEQALHDDLTIENFEKRTVWLRFTLVIDSDFSDIFQVKDRNLVSRLNIERSPAENGLNLEYHRRDFQRALRVRWQAKGATIVGSSIVFDVEIASQGRWTTCLDFTPEVQGERLEFRGEPHEPKNEILAAQSIGVRLVTDPLLHAPFAGAHLDFDALAVPQKNHPSFVAAGVPWFQTLFGRDTLLTSLLTNLDGTWPARGALNALAERQASERDDFFDAEPGKFLHETRRGELSHFREIPHAAYYGTHDAQALFVLALAELWRWTGKKEIVEPLLAPAEKALHWCETLGDRDGDGLLEYETRSPRGYYNQGWKDSGDAIVDAEGKIAKTPLATVELQGYYYAARLAMAELRESFGDAKGAERERAMASSLRELTEKTFWMEREKFYALALDGRKEQVSSISSNPGHLLFCGLPCPNRAKLTETRLMSSELFSGWGIRTLSKDHPAYNPISYQVGSVWPHDTLLAAIGLWRYGFFDSAEKLLHALLCAAESFEHRRLPELFCGFSRSEGFPVPYETANFPQAWASAVPLATTRLFLGLVPDAPRGLCVLNPRLPPWLTQLRIEGIEIGDGTLSVELVREGEKTVVKRIEAKKLSVEYGSPRLRYGEHRWGMGGFLPEEASKSEASLARPFHQTAPL